MAERLNLRTAYKYFDIYTDYKSGNLQKPIQPRNRLFANLSYETELSDTNGQWKFDVTFNNIGKQRLPSTNAKPIEYQLPAIVEPYQLLNAQITKVFSERFEVYLGAENLTNVQQNTPVLASDAPFGAHFDTTIVYAPIFGRSVYTGLRFNIN